MAQISIAMATYNGEAYIAEQIESILSQSFHDFELVIHDDCSTDGTYALLCDYAQKDSRIRMKRNEKNLGFAKNFAGIVQRCQGAYIAFADQDDIWTEHHLETLMNIIGDKDIACGNALLVDKNNDSLGVTMKQVVGMEKEPQADDMFWRLSFENFVQGTAMLVKKDLCDRYFPVPETVKYHDYWLALAASLENGIAYTPEIILRYRQHGNNVTHNSKTSLLREAYNGLTGFHRNHFAHQAAILDCLQTVFGNREEILQAKTFCDHCGTKKITPGDRDYFRKHYSEMFLTDKHYLFRKLIYLTL